MSNVVVFVEHNAGAPRAASLQCVSAAVSTRHDVTVA